MHCLSKCALVSTLLLVGSVTRAAIDAPSKLHANLGFIPFDRYTDTNNNPKFFKDCSTGWTIQQCFQNLLQTSLVSKLAQPIPFWTG